MTRHLTPGEKRAQERGRAAVARALAHTRPPPAQDDEADLAARYPYITTARAREIRLEIEADRAATWWPTPAQEHP